MDLFNRHPDIENEGSTKLQTYFSPWMTFWESRELGKEFASVVETDNLNLILKWMHKYMISSAPSTAPLKVPTHFVTISFNDNNINPSQIPEYMNKVVKYKWVEEYLYSIEQRSEQGDTYEGFHVHLLIKGNNKKCKIIKAMAKALSKYIDGPNFIDVQKCRFKHDVINRTNYIHGKKVDDSKYDKVIHDQKMRSELGLQPVYNNVPTEQVKK